MTITELAEALALEALYRLVQAQLVRGGVMIGRTEFLGTGLVIAVGAPWVASLMSTPGCAVQVMGIVGAPAKPGGLVDAVGKPL